MRRRVFDPSRSLQAVLGVCLVLALVRCGDRAPHTASPEASPLRVEAYLPQGATPSRSSVDVVFDRPMVRLGAGPPSFEAGRRILILEPQPRGGYAWIGTRTLSYTVPGGLASATTFRARVPAGVQALDHSRLQADVTWEFSTPRPRLEASVPAAGDSLARSGEPFVLLFNVAVEPRSVGRTARLEGVANFVAGRPDSLLLRQLGEPFWSADSSQLVRLEPRPRLEFDRAYRLVLGTDLRARDGPLGLESPLEVPFKTHGPPGLIGITAEGAAVVALRFATPVDADSVRRDVVFDPVPRIESGWGNGSRVFLTGEFGFEKTYTVTVPGGFPDLFGQRTTAAKTLQFTTGKREPTLQLLPSEAVLLPAAPRTVALAASGMEPVRLRVARLSVGEQILSLERPVGATRRWSFERRVETPADPGRLVTQDIDLRSLLPGKGLGAVIVEASARLRPAPGRESSIEGRDWSARAVLRWSDLGVTLKAAPENGLVWVTRLGTAEPVPRASVRVLDEKAKELWRGSTDSRGLVTLPGQRKLGRDPWQMTLVVASAGDTAMTRFVPDWRLEPWRYGIPGTYGPDPTPERAFLWSDRDLYRPGETVRLAGLVRKLDIGGLSRAGIDSLDVHVRDPLGSEAKKRTLALDRAGGFGLELPMPATAPLGRYSVEAAVPQRGKQGRGRQSIGTLGFEVAAFRAAPFRTVVRPRAAHLFPGEALSARITSSYYFGAPLARAPFSWVAVRERIAFAPRDFDEFTFSDMEVDAHFDGSLGAGTRALDDSGSALVRLVLPPEMPPATQAIRLEATVRDPSGDAVTGRTSTLYHPAPVYAGVAVAPDFVEAGGAVTARIVAVYADTARAAPGTPIEVELVRRDWRAARKLLVGGRVGYETTSRDTVLETRSVTAAAEPVEARFAPDTPGSYRVRVRARSGDKTSPPGAAWFWVAGDRAGAWRPTEAVQLEMKSDRRKYGIGDKARILVTTPVQARQGLLTVEREGLLESRLVPLGAGAPVIELPVKSEYLPNVYVGLAVAERALSAQEAPGLPEPARLPRFTAGYVPLRVEIDSRRLDVVVRPEKLEYRPGDRATIVLEIHNFEGRPVEGRLGVAVVDEAVLALLGTQVPDPFEFFYRERPLAVANNDTRLALSAGSRLEAARFKGESGGDGAEKLAARSLFTTTAYWNPAIDTDASGRAEIQFTLPDNLTSFRVAAIAASGSDRFGNGRGDFRVAKPLTIEPALPRFAIEGDTLEVAAVVTNRGSGPVTGRVRVETDLAPLGAVESKLSLQAGDSRRVAFRARATRAGDARMRFEAIFPDAQDAIETRLAVAASEVPKTAATAALATGPTTESVALPAAALPGSARLDVDLAASALAGARPAIEYVTDYPYECLEQLSSRVLVLVTVRKLFAISGADSIHLAERATQAIRSIESLATPWGSFAFWPGGSDAPAWMGAYATYALARARAAGFAVTPQILENAQFATVRAWREGPFGARQRPNRRRDAAPADRLETRGVPTGLALLALSELVRPERNAALEPADVDFLADAVDALPLDERLFMALALERWQLRREVVDRIAKTVLGHVEVTAAGAVLPNREMDDLPVPFRTSARATSLALWLGSRTRPRDALVPKLATGLLAMRAQGHWNTTQDDALALLALDAYRDAVEIAAGPVEASARLGALPEPLLQLVAPAGSLATEHASVALPVPGAPTGALPLEFSTRGPLHYTAVLRWAEDGRRQPADDTGFTLVRRLERYENDGPARLGDLVVVTLEIVVPRESWYLALVDPLPAGLEIVQTHFATESRAVENRLARWTSRHDPFPVTHVERRDRELRVFADAVGAGVYEHRYVTRVRAAGGFAHPPARIEAMYAPELHGRTASSRWRARGPSSGSGKR